MSMKRKTVPEPWREALSGFDDYIKAFGYAECTRRVRWNDIRRFSERIRKGPNDATTTDIVNFLGTCPSREYKKRTRASLKMFYSWYCGTAKLRRDNPTDNLPTVRESRPHPKPVPDNVIANALRKATYQERIAILLAAECGLRRAEIAQVHSDDVIPDTDGRRSLIVRGKGDKQRVIPLPDELADCITSANGYVFPGRFGGHVEVSYIGKHISRLLPDGYSAHKLRHRFATRAYADSHDLLAVSKALGHAKTETTQRYTAITDAQLRPLVDAATFGVEPATEKKDVCMASPLIPALPELPQSHPPTRRNDGGIRYATDSIRGEHGRVGKQPETIKAAIILCVKLLDGIQLGRSSFTYPAEKIAEDWSINDCGHARRSSIIRAGALVLQSSGLIELVQNHKGMLCGNITATSNAIMSKMYALSAEYCTLRDNTD